jgi:ABC-type Fe3+ transport system substrate-binding protein
MNTEAAKAFVEHYGVKGQKWGVRKATGSSTTRTTFKKAPSKLSTSELMTRIARMETEKKYNQLNKQDVSKGREFVNDVMTSVGRNVLKTALTGASLIAIRTAISSKFGAGVGEAVTRRLK